MSSPGEVIGGLLLVVLAGCLNGSWNVAFSDRFGMAVPKKKLESEHDDDHHDQESNNRTQTATPVDLDYHLSWALFQWYAALINILVCVYWAGGLARVTWLVRTQASSSMLIWIVTFSLLWGIGSVGFGYACRIAGIGMGTNLTMGVIMILGTLLPLFVLEEEEEKEEERVVRRRPAILIGVGLVICSVGLFFSMQSLRTRDLDEQEQQKKAEVSKEEQELTSTTTTPRTTETTGGKDNDDTTTKQQDEDDEENLKAMHVARETTSPLSSPSTLMKVGVCIFAGIFASQLQFAFVFGRSLVDAAGDSEIGPGSTPASGTAAIIWLFAIPISAPVSILYGLYSSPKPLSTLWKCPLKRHLLVLCTTSLPWVGHIHCYGYSSHLLNPSVSWPILMSTTVAAGMIWSLLLGEWKDASSQSRRQLYIGLSVVVLGVVVLMTSVIPTADGA